MRFLFLCLIVLALTTNAVSENCSIRGKLRSDPFSTNSLCTYYYNCDTIQVCTNVTGSLEWTNICFDEEWDQNSIDVSCRQFGYSGANSVSGSLDGVYRSIYNYGANEVKLSNIDCTGDENDVLSCRYNTTNSECRYPLYDPSAHCCNQGDCPIDSSSSTFTPSFSSSPPSALSSSVVMDTTTILTTKYSIISSSQLSSSFFPSTYGTQASSTSLTSDLLTNVVPGVPITLTTMNLISVEIPSTPTSIISNVISLSVIPTPSFSREVTSTLSLRTSSTMSNVDTQTLSGSDGVSSQLTHSDSSVATILATSVSSGDSATVSSSIPSESNSIISTSINSILNDVTSLTTTLPISSDSLIPTFTLSTSFDATSASGLLFPTPPPDSIPSPGIPSTTSTTTSALYCTDCFSSSVVTSTTYSTTFFPSTYTVQATSTGTPSTPSTTTSSSLPTQFVASTQQSRMSLMLIPILVPIIAILVILTILTIVILVLSCIFCSRRKRTKGSTDNDEAAMYTELSGITSLKSQVENQNAVIMNGDANYTAINESSLMDRDYDYAEIGKRTLDSEDVQEYLAPITDNYSSIENELYGHLVEGEVSNWNLYEQLPGMDQAAYHKLVAISSTLKNPLYDILVKESPNEEPIYIDPPSSLPQLENVFGQCLNEIRRKDIQMGEEFASGQFGVVYRAVYHTEKGDIPVAIKTLKEAANTDTKVAFMREAAILAQFQHPNVLRMIGVLTTQQPYMMVTELLKTELADLLLKMKSADSTHRQNLPPLLLRFCQEIAAGMKHLSEKHFIHRDLAARNVLVAKDLSCRIADFGMSRELHSDSEYYTSSGGRVPLRWTAPEAVFYKKYSEKSDVWSFGMTMYEIWSLGEKPWGWYTSNDEIVEGMSQGKKLSPPTGCPRDVYRVMVETWRADASVRPTFSDAQVMLTDAQLPPPIPGVNEPSRCLGNDPVLAQDLYLDLQQVQ